MWPSTQTFFLFSFSPLSCEDYIFESVKWIIKKKPFFSISGFCHPAEDMSGPFVMQEKQLTKFERWGQLFCLSVADRGDTLTHAPTHFLPGNSCSICWVFPVNPIETGWLYDTVLTWQEFIFYYVVYSFSQQIFIYLFLFYPQNWIMTSLSFFLFHPDRVSWQPHW